MLAAATRRLGVLGWPVAHSRSPAIHAAAFAALGMDGWRYQRLPVPPELFAETARALGGAGFAGANVTVPHKEAALAVATEATGAARAIGAANTLTFGPGGVIAAGNTDAPGLLAARALDDVGAVVDLVYREGATALVRAAQRRGLPTADGLEVLVQQGARSFAIWTGRRPPLDVMRAALDR